MPNKLVFCHLKSGQFALLLFYILSRGPAENAFAINDGDL